MTRSLSGKLILAFLLVSLSGALLVALVAGWTTINTFDRFRLDQRQQDIVILLTNYYEAEGSWNSVEQLIPRLDNGRGGPAQGAVLVDENGRVLTRGMGFMPGQRVPPDVVRQGTPIEVDNELVGMLLWERPSMMDQMINRSRAEAEALFLRRVGLGFFFGVLGGTAVALVLGVWLARTLTRPVRELTSATQAIAQGSLDQTVPVRSQDELGQLAASFNQMSSDLARSQQQRRQMTADIAHDLRTPLSVILGHAEALSDGVLPPTPDTFNVLHDEARRLQRLVDDLRTLSLAEAGELTLNKRPVDPSALLEQALAAHTPRAQQAAITLSSNTPDTLPDVLVDPDRIGQVLDNLLSNALRHTPAGGDIRLRAAASVEGVVLSVIDSGPGIAPDDLPNIFGRFYRGDKARQRHEGASGLGLAIAQSMVLAHNGRIWAENNPDNGAAFHLILPTVDRETA